jgi:hypothetical protein
MNPMLLESLVKARTAEIRRSRRRARRAEGGTRAWRARHRHAVRQPLGFLLVELGLRLVAPPRRSLVPPARVTPAS